jgi:hypothetical protein
MRVVAFVFIALFSIYGSICAAADPKWDSPYMRCLPFDEKGRKIVDDEDCPQYETTIIQLLARPELFDGKRVVIRGYVHREFEDNGIYIRQEDFADHLTHNGLWIGGFRDEARMQNCQDGYVTLVGVFHAQEYGHMGAWSGTIDDISTCVGP